jgi:hypothetical protein
MGSAEGMGSRFASVRGGAGVETHVIRVDNATPLVEQRGIRLWKRRG